MEQTARTINHANATAQNLPSVTMGMLLDFLSKNEYEILYQPQPKRRLFRWFSAFSHETFTCAAPPSVPDANLLFVCQEADAESLLSQRPSVFALVIAGESTSPHVAEKFSERAIVVRRQDRFSFFLFQLQSYFTQLLLWESEMSGIIANHGTLTDILDSSTAIIRNFMFISDAKLNLLARTTAIEPPDELHRKIAETGCLTPQLIEEERTRLPEKAFYIREPSEVSPYARLAWPIYVNHSYFGSLSISCHNTPLTEGLKDLLVILAKRVTTYCETTWRAQIKHNVPHYFFLTKMLEHEEVTEEYLRTQMKLAGFDEKTEFKLIALNVDENVDPERAELAARAANGINRGSVYCLPYQNMILTLCYSRPSDNRLSHIRTLQDLHSRIYEPLGIVSSTSEIFTDITNLDLAFRQAKIAIELKDVIDSEQFTIIDGYAEGVYLFSDALAYALLDPSNKDKRFIDFCFSHTILHKMYAEDKRDGTNHLALFWFYLRSGCSASDTAQQLHIHRNTVIYRINKIQERFDFDLRSATARDRMVFDFKMFFLTNDGASTKRIFARPLPESTENESCRPRP